MVCMYRTANAAPAPARHSTAQHNTVDTAIQSNPIHLAEQCKTHHRPLSCHRTQADVSVVPGAWRTIHRQCWESSALEALEEGDNTNPLESSCDSLGDPGCEATDLAPGHRQPHPHQLAASNPDHVLHACNPAQTETKRGEPLPITGPGHAHMYPDAYDLSSLSLATSNQSVALISINHMSDSIERYLTACTPGESDMSTVPLCLPKPPIPTRPPPLTSHAAAACHQAKPTQPNAAGRHSPSPLPSHPPAIPLCSRHSCHSSHSSRRRCTSTRTSCR